MSDQQQDSGAYIWLDDAARELGVNNSTLYYYFKQLTITPTKFPLDKRKYLTREELERIKEVKAAAQARRQGPLP